MSIKPILKYPGAILVPDVILKYQNVSKCGIIDEYETRIQALATPISSRLLNLTRRFFAMSELYHVNQPDTKVCPKCDPPTAKPLSAFGKNKNTSDGLHAWCKECKKAYNHQYYRDNHDRLLDRQKQYEREHRDEALERVRQWRKDNPDSRAQESKKHYASHKESESARGKHYREQNLEKNRARGRKYYEENSEKFKPNYHKRRAMKLANGGSYTPQQWRDLCECHQYTCLCCKRQEPETKLTPDHVVPLSKGGSNDITNIQPLCLSCNISKNSKTIDYREMGNETKK